MEGPFKAEASGLLLILVSSLRGTDIPDIILAQRVRERCNVLRHTAMNCDTGL